MVGTAIRSSIAVLQSIIARFQAGFPDSEQLVTGSILHSRDSIYVSYIGKIYY